MEIEKKTAKSHDGLTLYYETHDLDGKKPIIFFVHGAGGDIDAWQYVRPQILEKGFASISLDIRGHGHSAHPRTPHSYELKNFVSDIITILNQEKIEKVIMIGHSFGAIIATHFAIEHPERLNKLVLISGTYRAPNHLTSARTKSIANKFIDFAALISPPPIFRGHSTYPKGKFHKDVELFGLIRTILRNSWASYLLTSKQAINLDIKEKLKNIHVPTLLIAGTKDSINSISILHEMHNEIPDSSLEIIEGANHVVILNNIDKVAEVINNFLSQ